VDSWTEENIEKLRIFLRNAIDIPIYGAELHIYGLWAKQKGIPDYKIPAYLKQVMLGPDHALEEPSCRWTPTNSKGINDISKEIKDSVDHQVNAFTKVSKTEGGHRVQILYNVNIPSSGRENPTIYEQIGDYPPLPEDLHELLMDYIRLFSYGKRIRIRRRFFEIVNPDTDIIDLVLKTGQSPTAIRNILTLRKYEAEKTRDDQQIVEHGSVYPYEEEEDENF